MQEALALGDRICLMNKGKIEQIGTPDEIEAILKMILFATFYKRARSLLKKTKQSNR